LLRVENGGKACEIRLGLKQKDGNQNDVLYGRSRRAVLCGQRTERAGQDGALRQARRILPGNAGDPQQRKRARIRRFGQPDYRGGAGVFLYGDL